MLHTWCKKWRIEVITQVKQILFITGRDPKLYKQILISIMEMKLLILSIIYRYLGLVLNELMDYTVTCKIIISKSKAYGGMPYASFTKLYHSLLQPILDYGGGLFGGPDHLVVLIQQFTIYSIYSQQF